MGNLFSICKKRDYSMYNESSKPFQEYKTVIINNKKYILMQTENGNQEDFLEIQLAVKVLRIY